MSHVISIRRYDFLFRGGECALRVFFIFQGDVRLLNEDSGEVGDVM
jgi:hypothetical protein